MSKSKKSMAEYAELSARFITLANEMKDEGKPMEMVSAALMSASGVYATYVAAGNEGCLKPGGIDKVVATYRANLENVQKFKREVQDREGK